MSETFVKLGSVAEFINGVAFKPEDWGDSGTKIIRIQNLTNPSKPFNRTERTVSDKYCVRPSDLLVSWSATLGVFEWPGPDKALLNQHIFRVLPDEKKVEKRYLRYALEGALLDMQRHLHGATMQHVNRDEFLNTKLFLPSLPDQRRIAEILDCAEALRAKRRDTLSQLDELVKSVFIEMFGDPRSLTKEKNARLKLRDVIDIIVPTRDKPKSFTGNIPWITLPDLANSMYIEDSKYKLSKEEARPTKTRLFPKETVILSCAGSLGKVAISMNEVYTNQQFYGLVCDKKRIIPEFLAYYLLLFGEDYYQGISGTSTLAFFKKESALNIEIMLPDISNQIYFSQIVKQIEKIKQSQQQSSLEINNLFDALMQKAFIGKLFSHQSFERHMRTE